VILVGHAGHPEVVGTLGHLPGNCASLVGTAAEAAALELTEETPVGVAVQTTYSVEEAAEVLLVLRGRFPNLVEPPASDICYATTNRQAAVRVIAARADAMIVAGESFSSNACRLAEVALAAGCTSVQRVADASEIDWNRLPPNGAIGLTAAASTPDSVIDEIQRRLERRYRVRLEEVKAAEENVVFRPVAIA
jgi:4-hydroxy-3-methylbut-2-enyl diphosphate reductase